MYSRDQILLEQAYQQTIQKDKNCWCLTNVKQLLQEQGFVFGERTAVKGDIILELRESKTPYLHIKVVSRSDKFSEITFGGNTPDHLTRLTSTLESLEKDSSI
jgi:hypothetical protein